ncbi:MAG: DUF2510 domain-containing protein [Cryobacterium sp.]
MTQTPESAAHPPGWYADPMGSPRQRWWDGDRWTADLHDPSLEVYGVAAPTAPAVPIGPVSADTPVYNNFIWAIVLLPVVTLIAASSVDTTASLARAFAGDSSMDPAETLSGLLSWAVYLGTVALAFLDRRQLARDGFAKPFHWGWAFLAAGVYVVGRSVIVRRRSGRGLTPIWVWVGITVVSVIIGVSRMIAALNEIMPDGSLPT